MAKIKIPFNDLQRVKEGFKQEKIAQHSQELGVNEPPTPMHKKMAIAKAAGRNSKLNETGMTPKEIEKQRRKKRKKIKKDFSDTRSIKTSYGFKEGDLVSFNFNKKQEVGIVFKIKEYEKTSHGDALTTDLVEILSSAGYVSVVPKAIYEIIECN